MSLADYQPERTQVQHRGRVLVSVRGLSMVDLTALVRSHLNDLKVLMSFFDERGNLPAVTPDMIDQILFTLVSKAPEAAAMIIALASDEPGEIDKARALPAPLQMKILIEVVHLTFEDVGGPLAFGGMLAKLVAQVSPQGSLPPPIQTVQ